MAKMGCWRNLVAVLTQPVRQPKLDDKGGLEEPIGSLGLDPWLPLEHQHKIVQPPRHVLQRHGHILPSAPVDACERAHHASGGGGGDGSVGFAEAEGAAR